MSIRTFVAFIKTRSSLFPYNQLLRHLIMYQRMHAGTLRPNEHSNRKVNNTCMRKRCLMHGHYYSTNRAGKNCKYCNEFDVPIFIVLAHSMNESCLFYSTDIKTPSFIFCLTSLCSRSLDEQHTFKHILNSNQLPKIPFNPFTSKTSYPFSIN